MLNSIQIDPLVKMARSYMIVRLKPRRALIANEDGIERRPFFTCLDETASLVSTLGYGPRVIAASYLQYESHADRANWYENVFEADISNLLRWVRGDYLAMPRFIFDTCLQTRLRFAPPAALTLLLARQLINLRSIATLSEEEVREGLLDTVGWEPLPLPLDGPLYALGALTAEGRGRVAEVLLEELTELIDRVQCYAGWLGVRSLPVEEASLLAKR